MADHHVRTADAHLQDDDHNWYPERTIPQGTQENGVDFQHEGRDANLRSVINWFAALGVGVLVVVGLLFAAFQLLLQREAGEKALPSPVFAQRQPLPEPRLIPNPVDSQPGQALIGPIEYYQEYEAREHSLLSEAGLYDPASGLYKLPEDVTGSVLQELNGGAPATARTPPPSSPHEMGVSDLYPSDMSGGTLLEDRLR